MKVLEPPGEKVVPDVEDMKASEGLLLDPEPKDLIPEEEARKRNQAWEEFVKKEVKEISKDVPVVNITFMEPLASRHQNEITKALSKLHARAKSLGIPISVRTPIGSDLLQPTMWPSGAKRARSIKRSMQAMSLRLMDELKGKSINSSDGFVFCWQKQA